MKGIVFTEFLDMAEEKFGPEVVDEVLEASDLPNGGAYTAVGTYDHSEMLRMVGALSRSTSLEAPELVKAFGEHLAGRFVAGYPLFFAGISSTFDFLPTIESHIHVEVRKLYSDADLPTFTCERLGPDRMQFEYRSPRPFADLAEGLMAGTAKHFGETIGIEREDLAVESGYAARFVLTRMS